MILRTTLEIFRRRPWLLFWPALVGVAVIDPERLQRWVSESDSETKGETDE